MHAKRAKQQMWALPTCKADAGTVLEASSWLGPSLRIPAERVNFWAALRRGHTAHLIDDTYVLMISLAPHPSLGYIGFPMSLLDADKLEADQGVGTGVLGEWRLDANIRGGVQEKPRLTLLRVTSPQQFVHVLKNELLHPEWLKPCYREIPETMLQQPT